MARFTGIITPLVTPFHRDEQQSINYEATEQLIEYVLDGGVSGLFLLGSNGEFHLIDHQEKIEFARFVVEKVHGRVPVYAGSGCCSTRETVELSKELEAVGVDALSVINPYFIQPKDSELFEHYRKIAESVNIPIILYNIPKTTGKNLSKELVGELAKINNIQGIKDSSGNLDNLQDYLDVCEGNDVDVLVGSDSKIMRAVEMGASGAVAGASNLIPHVLVDLFNAASDGRTAEAQKLQDSLEELRNVLHMGTVPALLKRPLELIGIPVGPARYPVLEADPAADEAAKKMIAYYGLTLK